MIREIVKIDEEKCDGCGICIPNCHEGALQIIDGKARLVSELMCDGLGACIGHCPQDAITIEEREADAYDEIATISQMIKQGKSTVFAHLKHLQDHNETGYLQQALGFIKANREAMPFEISEVHELLHGGENQEVQGSGGCATGVVVPVHVRRGQQAEGQVDEHHQRHAFNRLAGLVNRGTRHLDKIRVTDCHGERTVFRKVQELACQRRHDHPQRLREDNKFQDMGRLKPY